MKKTFDYVDFIIKLENHELSEQEIIDGFQEMIDSGIVWQLQGYYWRVAEILIKEGYCRRAQNI